MTSGLALILAVALCVWGLRAHAKGHPVRRAAALQLVFMLTEAAVGAGLVLFQYVAHNQSIGRAFWMAAHLLNTFLLVGAQALTAWHSGGRARMVLRGQGLTGTLVVVSVSALTLLGMTGAIAALGDTLFPASSLMEGFQQDVSETAHFLLRLRVLHPLLAIAVGALVVAMASAVSRLRPSAEVKRGAVLLGVLYALQLAAGVTNLVLLAPVWMQLVHLLLADLVWISLVRLSAAGLAEDAPRAELRPSPERTPSASGSAWHDWNRITTEEHRHGNAGQQVASVTGASSGIGWGTALALAAAGAWSSRALAVRTGPRAHRPDQAARRRGHWVSADMQVERDVEKMVKTAVSTSAGSTPSQRALGHMKALPERPPPSTTCS